MNISEDVESWFEQSVNTHIGKIYKWYGKETKKMTQIHH